eukprot:scaffold152988_cov42-Prasinocladus_malaysianus.AAC.1
MVAANKVMSSNLFFLSMQTPELLHFNGKQEIVWDMKVLVRHDSEVTITVLNASESDGRQSAISCISESMAMENKESLWCASTLMCAIVMSSRR